MTNKKHTIEENRNTHHHKPKPGKNFEISGNFLYFDNKNLNGRIYKKEMAQDIVDQFNAKLKKDRQVLGTLGHPEPNKNFDKIHLNEVSHEVKEIHFNEDNNSIEGTIRILDTPNGKIIQRMIEESVRRQTDLPFYCRSRGIADVSDEGIIENYKIVSFDLIEGPDGFGNITDNKSDLKVNTMPTKSFSKSYNLEESYDLIRDVDEYVEDNFAFEYPGQIKVTIEYIPEDE